MAVYGPDVGENLLSRRNAPDFARGVGSGRRAHKQENVRLRRRTERPGRPTCWPAVGGCRARPAGRPAGLGRARSAQVHRATRTWRRSRSSRCFSRQTTSPASAGLAPSATRYFTLPSNSPTTPSQPKSTKPTRPAASRISFCSSGLGRLSRNIWTRDRLSPALMLNGSASAPTRRAVLRPRTRGGTASTSAMSSSNEQSPWRRAWSAAATAVWRVPVRARSTTVLAALVTRMSPIRTVSASRPTCGRTSDDPRPRSSVATSTRTASGHFSIRGSPQTAAAEVTANTGFSRSRHRPVAWTSAACSCSGVRPRHSCSLTHTPFRTWCQPPRVGSMPAARRSRPRRRMPASNGVGAAGPSTRSPCQNPPPPPLPYPQGSRRPSPPNPCGVRSTSPAQEILAESGSYTALTRRSAPDFAKRATPTPPLSREVGERPTGCGIRREAVEQCRA